MRLRPAGRLGRIAAFTIAIALVAGGAALASPGHGLVTDALARAAMPDGDREQPPPHQVPPAPPVPAVPMPAPADELTVVHGAPRLQEFDPKTSGVPISSPIVIEFTQPMDQVSVEASFVILPKIDGRFSWRDLTLRFEPFRLAYETAYHVEVGGRSGVGKRLIGTRSWDFSTGSAPPDQVAPGPLSIKVPILTYHYIRNNPDPRDRLGYALSATPTDFAAQMDWLARNGYHPITTEDLYAYLNRERGLPSKPVVLTFDDGYADFYTTALPILRSHEFKATAYIVWGFVGRGGYMNAEQVREADRSGIEIGSHSVSHANLAGASAANVRVQVGDSKRYLEQLLGHPVNSFCYPSGKHSPAVANAVAAAGYHDATTTSYGFWHSLGDRYAWTRLRVGGGQGLGDFAQAVTSAS